MPRRPGSPWPPAERTRALELYQSDGLAAAHRATGIPKGTIRDWAAAAQIPRGGPRSDAKRTEAATAELATVLDEARDRRSLQLATVAEYALDELVIRLGDEAERAKIPPRDLVGIFTRANHDLALLTGAATEHQAVTVLFNVPPPDDRPPTVYAEDDLPALGA